MNVEIPGVGIVEFPDGTSPEVIRQVYEQARRGQPDGVSEFIAEADAQRMPEGMVMNPRTGQVEDLRSPANPNIPNAPAAIGGLQGLSYDFGDEVVGALRGGLDPQARTYETEVMREADRRAKDAAPVSYGAAKIGGAVAQSVGLGRALGITAAPTTTGRAVQGAGIGGLEGMAFGAGQGEDMRGRLTGAAQYGAMGAGIGAAAPFAVDGARKGFDALVAGPVASMRSAPSDVRAGQAVARAMRRAGMTADDLDNALQTAGREGQPEFVAADALGRPGARLLGSLNRSDTDAQQQIADFLINRQVSQPERLARFTEEAFDLGGETARSVREGLKAGRNEAADIVFGGIRSTGNPVDVRPVVAAIDERLAPFAEAGVNSPVNTALRGIRQRLAGQGADGADYALSDFSKVFAIRKELADDISAAFRGGRAELGRELRAVREAFDSALAASSDDYAQAMQNYASQSRVMEAVDAGQQMARSGARAADNLADFARMNGDQQAAARVGYGDRVMSRIEGAAGEWTNRARPLTSEKARQEFGGMAVDPALYSNRIGRENVMFETGRKAMGGSETAERLADDAGLDMQSMGAIANLLRGNVGQAATQAGLSVGNALTGRNTATREQIARILLSRDPKAALELALRSETMGNNRAAIADALLRSLPRPAQ